MMNTQLMAVLERTREIGVLRAVGWSRRRVMSMILLESLAVGIFGGLLGLLMGYALIDQLSRATVILGLDVGYIRPDLVLQSFVIVLLLGVLGGVYPAYAPRAWPRSKPCATKAEVAARASTACRSAGWRSTASGSVQPAPC